MNPVDPKPAVVKASKTNFGPSMGAFKQVSTRFDIASLTGSNDHKPEPENRSLLELSRLMTARNRESQTMRHPRKRRFDIASLTGTSTDDESRSPGSPELDVVALDSCSSMDSVQDNKKSRKSAPDDGTESTEDACEPKNFSLARCSSSDHGSAFRKIDKQLDLSSPRHGSNELRLSPSHRITRVNMMSPDSARLIPSTVSSPIMNVSSHPIFVSQAEVTLPPNKFPFHEEPFNFLKLSPEMKSPTMITQGDENRSPSQHSRLQSAMVHVNSNKPTNAPPPPLPSAIEPFSSKSYSHSLLSFLPPSLAALSFPTQNWCAKCNATFRMTSDLVYHMRSHHKRETDTGKKKREEKLRCDICKESFRERHHLTRHMTSHQ